MRLSPKLPYVYLRGTSVFFSTQVPRCFSLLSLSPSWEVSVSVRVLLTLHEPLVDSVLVSHRVMSLNEMEVERSGALSSEEEGQIMDDEEDNVEKPEEAK